MHICVLKHHCQNTRYSLNFIKATFSVFEFLRKCLENSFVKSPAVQTVEDFGTRTDI